MDSSFGTIKDLVVSAYMDCGEMPSYERLTADAAFGQLLGYMA
jgi:hypothetical protein